MTPADFVEQLLAPNANLADLAHHLHAFPQPKQTAVIAALREAFIRALRVSGAAADRCAARAGWVADQTGQPRDRAFALRLEAQSLLIAHGKYEASLPLFDRSADLYRQLGDEVERANVAVSAIWAIALAHGYDAAVERSASAAAVLKSHEQWRSLATLNNNLAAIHNRFGRFALALDALDTARAAYLSLGSVGEPYLTNIDTNRAYVLYTLGRFRESIAASEAALARAVERGQDALVARCQHNLALTYYALGNYRRSLELFDRARDGWLADGRLQEVVQTELSATYALLRLRRFHDVLGRCERVRQLIAQHGVAPETPFSLLNEAFAYGELGRHDSAADALNAIRHTVEQHGSRWDQVRLQLAECQLMLARGEAESAERHALALLPDIREQEGVALARLLAAQGALAQAAWERSRDHAERVLQHAADAPYLTYEARRVLGQAAQREGRLEAAQTHLQHALDALESINVMSEHRARFLEDESKRLLFCDLVELALAQDAAATALAYAERSRSRTLQDLISNRVDLSIRALDERDRSIVNQFNQLNEQRRQLVRQQEQETDEQERARFAAQQRTVEAQVTETWHQLLIRNEAYTRVSPFAAHRPELPDDTVLLNYYTLHDDLVLFLSRPGEARPTVYRLPLTATAFQRLQASLQLNLRLIGRTPPALVPRFLPNVNGVLRRIYDGLLAPCIADLPTNARLIIVPHGRLHYLPFHALLAADGRYLLETHPVSYLPAAAFLRESAECSGKGMVALGYSAAGRLPAAVEEARRVARPWSHRLLLEQEATVGALTRSAADCAVLHLATHAEFRADNPLFSGLQLADGWLTTLDIFNMRLNTQLVTLSACSTGRSNIGGGDELLGLTRAFMAAGASSLLMTHWAVVDDVTQRLITDFYERLAAGEPKDRALQQAQLNLLNGARETGHAYQHPYFWSPFFLIGATGRLT